MSHVFVRLPIHEEFVWNALKLVSTTAHGPDVHVSQCTECQVLRVAVGSHSRYGRAGKLSKTEPECVAAPRP